MNFKPEFSIAAMSKSMLRQTILLIVFMLGWASIAQAGTAQTISLSFHLPASTQLGGSVLIGISAAAFSSSSLPVSLISITPSICSLINGLVSAVAVGTCTIAANQAGNAVYNAAPQVTQSMQVTQPIASQTIGAITFTPATLSVGGTSTASATATSGLAVSFNSATISICTVNGNIVTGLAPGTCTIVANQVGGASLAGGTYSPAFPKTQNIVIGISQSDCLFNWAEKSYAQYFFPAGAVSHTDIPPYTYRHYSGTGNYLAVSSADNNVYVLGPISGNNLLRVGPVTSLLGLSGCQ